MVLLSHAHDHDGTWCCWGSVPPSMDRGRMRSPTRMFPSPADASSPPAFITTAALPRVRPRSLFWVSRRVSLYVLEPPRLSYVVCQQRALPIARSRVKSLDVDSVDGTGDFPTTHELSDEWEWHNIIRLCDGWRQGHHHTEMVLLQLACALSPATYCRGWDYLGRCSARCFARWGMWDAASSRGCSQRRL